MTAKETKECLKEPLRTQMAGSAGKRKLLVAVDTKTTTAEENRGNVTRAN